MRAMPQPPRSPAVRAYLFGPTVVFYLLAVTSLASLVSVLALPESAIDHDLARGLRDAEQGTEQERDQPTGTEYPPRPAGRC